MSDDIAIKDKVVLGKLLKFRGQWRVYQKRILDDLEFHLADKKLHIVAAPGAGKTTLGIEVLSRLNKPSLILCPTNTIKNQWQERVASSFLEGNVSDVVSTNIRDPKFLTIITYQALLASFCGKDEVDVDEAEEDTEEISTTVLRRFSEGKANEIIKILKKAKISILCFDEAHHLRKEWWKALSYLVDYLEPKQTVALTATPPYDVDYAEWERYEKLCGPIDEVISIPELVKNGDLCPHQDFIHFSNLREDENSLLRKYNLKVAEFLSKILADKELLFYLNSMDFLNSPEGAIAKIFETPEFYVSIVSLLKSHGYKIPKGFLKLFEAKETEIPKFNLEQAKIFLNGFMFTNTEEFKPIESKVESYLNMAKRSGLVQNKKIVLMDSQKIQKKIANSLGKLDSIVEIVDLEASSLGKDLRMVILTDYIKKDDVDNSSLGVLPIWRTVKEKFGENLSLVVLCGSLIIIPKASEKVLLDLLEKNFIEKDCITITTFKEDENYLKILPNASVRNCIVSLITEMFSRGEFQVMVGTQALLGEGWDAPCVNSLILSSTVSSYMLSNQMRGRAIRRDKNNPDKVANIWHLASVRFPDAQTQGLFSASISEGEVASNETSSFYDLNQLTKRFEGFEAPSYFDKHEIMSGISRVIPESVYTNALFSKENAFLQLNVETKKRALDRAQTKKWWNDALYLGYGGRRQMSLTTGVETPKLSLKSLKYQSYKDIFLTLVTVFFIALYQFLGSGIRLDIVLELWFIAFVCVMAWIGIKYLRTGSVSSIMRQIAIVHLETLSNLGYIKSNLSNVGISVIASDWVFVSCRNLQMEENNLLIKSLQEFLDPIDNPRYVLVKKNLAKGFIKQTDYFAIPQVLSTRKRDVEMFKTLWEKYIGSCEIVYTRNLEGRKLLLKARKNAFSALKRDKSRKKSKWC